MAERARVHILTTTHTMRHLAGLLAGLSRQTDPPDSITIACDTDDSAIGEVISEWRPRLPAGPVKWVRRAHTGEARPSQARNNGVRALLEAGELQDRDLILQIDGDIVLSDSATAQHRDLAAGGFEVIVADRVNLTEEETRSFDAAAYARNGAPLRVSEAEAVRLRFGQRMYTRQLRRRALPWAKPHKPALFGHHNAVSVRVYREVNGYDEEYVGWGREDTDFSRRLNSLRPRLKVSMSIDTILGFHLWHPTRYPEDFRRTSSYLRFKRKDLPRCAVNGLTSPRDQPEPVCTVFD